MDPMSLPVADAVFGRVPLPDLAVAAGVCQTWREVAFAHVPDPLVVNKRRKANVLGLLEAGLHRCNNLRVIKVSSTGDASWPPLAKALAAQRLPSLRELHIQHSSSTGADQLQQLAAILQVQGSECRLSLAVTDTQSLEALLPLLPMQGLSSLELNVPRLARGMPLMLRDAAAAQAAAGVSDGSGPLRVSVWVCCWGGCPGLEPGDALSIWQLLREVPGCVVTGLADIQLPAATAAADLQSLQQLRGLETLGLSFPARTEGTSSAAAATHGVAATLGVLSGSLKELSLRRCPADGWQGLQRAAPHPGQQQQQQQHPLAGLTGLSKLLIREEHFAPAALPLAPLAQLILLQELVLESHRRLARPDELSVLSGLSALRTLSLKMATQAALGSRDAFARAERSAMMVQLQAQLYSAGCGSRGRQPCWCCPHDDAPSAAAGAGTAPLPLEGSDLQPSAALDVVRACPVLQPLRYERKLRLLDWAWMRQLRKLESARLQVPQLDLSCLPSSLVELRVELGIAITLVTCDNGVNLPNLQVLTLPTMETVALLLQEDAESRAEAMAPARSIDSDGDDDDCRGARKEPTKLQVLRRHTQGALLLEIVCGCPALTELELVDWRPPAQAVLGALRGLRHLRRLKGVCMHTALCDRLTGVSDVMLVSVTDNNRGRFTRTATGRWDVKTASNEPYWKEHHALLTTALSSTSLRTPIGVGACARA